MIQLSSNLRTRLLLIVLIAVAPVVVLMFFLDIDQRQKELRRAEKELTRLAQLASSQQQQLIQSTHLLLATLARMPDVWTENPTACSVALAELLKLHNVYANLGLSDSRGNIHCSALPIAGQINISDRRYFRDALSARAFSVGAAQIGRISGKAVQVYGHAVLDRNGAVHGVVYAALDLDWLRVLAHEAKMPEDAAMLVIDRLGTLLAHYPNPEKWIGTDTAQAPIVRVMLNQQTGSTETSGIDGVTRLYAFRPLDGSSEPIYVAIGITKQSISAVADRILLISLAGLILAGGLVYVFARFAGQFFIMRQVQGLVATVNRLSMGEFNARTELSYNEGELGILAKSLDDMAQALERLTRRNQLILTSAGEGILGVDRNGLTTFANPAAVQMLGYELPQILGRPAYEVLQPSRADGTVVPRPSVNVSGYPARDAFGLAAHSLPRPPCGPAASPDHNGSTPHGSAAIGDYAPRRSPPWRAAAVYA